MRKFDTAHWLRILEGEGVPCGPINGMSEVFTNPQILHRNMKVAIPELLGAERMMVGSPLNLSETPVEYRRAPPALGAHTKEILQNLLGLDEVRIVELANQQVIKL